jgi:hypothetical protein
MTNREIANALREHALYHRSAWISGLKPKEVFDAACNVVIDDRLWWKTPTKSVLDRMLLCFIAESLS